MSHLKIYLAACTYLIVTSFAIAQDPTTYIFNGSVDNIWNTIENWTPSYPGTSINEGETIIIDAVCLANDHVIEIGGGLIVNAGKSLTLRGADLIVTTIMSIEGELSIQTNSVCTNSGYTTVESTGEIINQGSVMNKAIMFVEGAIVNNGRWLNEGAGNMEVLSAATFNNENYIYNKGTISDYGSGFINNGNLDNYGVLHIIGAFINAGDLKNQFSFYIDGSCTSTTGSNILNHRNIEISGGGELRNSGTTFNFSAAELSNYGTIHNTESGMIYNEGRIITKGGTNFMLKRGSYLENTPGSAVTVNQ